MALEGPILGRGRTQFAAEVSLERESQHSSDRDFAHTGFHTDLLAEPNRHTVASELLSENMSLESLIRSMVALELAPVWKELQIQRTAA